MLSLFSLSDNNDNDQQCPEEIGTSKCLTLHEELYHVFVLANLYRITVQLILDIFNRHGMCPKNLLFI